MIDLSHIEKITVVLISLTGVWLAFWVYSTNKKEELNQWFTIMTFFVVLWVDFAYLGYKTREDFMATIFYRLNWGFVALFLVSSYYFYVLYFLKEKGKYLILEKFVLFTGILLVLSSLFTGFIIKETIIQDWGAEIIFGPGNDLFNLYALSVSLLVVGFLIKRYIHLSKRQKIKVQYFLTGTFFFVLFNIIFNVVFPTITGTVEYQHFGDYSAIILLIFTAYAITKHELMGIKTLITKTLIAAISIILLIDLLVLTDNLTMQLLKAGILAAFLYFSQGMTESIKKEKKARKELEKLNLKLKNANQRLKELLEVKNEFLHITSHQLRTPLTAIRGMISMWYEGSFDHLSKEKKKKMLRALYISTERLNNITNDMLNSIELEGGVFDFQFKQVSLKKVIKESINILKFNYDKKGLYLNFDAKNKKMPVIEIEAEPNYVRQIFLNLIDNACKYTNKGGVDIDVKKSGKYAKITIKDTGIGVSKRDQKKIFQKFTRSKEAMIENAAGSGLGLFIVEKVVKSHYGKIEFYSKGKGKGSTVKVYLPIKQE